MRIYKIRSAKPVEPIQHTAQVVGMGSLLGLISETEKTMEVSKLSMEILSKLSSWTRPSPDKNKFIDYYDSGDLKKASKLCSTLTGNPKSGHEVVMKLVYAAIRQHLERDSKHVNDPVKMNGRGAAVPAPVKTRVKNQLHDICKKTWQSIPLDEILWTLKKNGLMALQEDGTEWSGMLMGTKECGDPEANNQRVSWPVAMQSPEDCDIWIMTNTAVQLSWCVRRYDPMTFEIVVYMG